jgi:hypothetical protein
MEFERKLRMPALAFALLFRVSSAAAAERGPLIIPATPDANLILLSEDGRPSEQPVDEPAARFSLAIAQAIQLEQRSIEQACRSGAPTIANYAIRFDWQAKCLYRRH